MLTHKELQLIAGLLDMASDTFSNHGCNDMDRTLTDKIGFTDEEKIELARQLHALNEFEEDMDVTTTDFDWIGDSSWMSFMARKVSNTNVVNIEGLPNGMKIKEVLHIQTEPSTGIVYGQVILESSESK